ncbi:dihydrolipoamide dehydrogenase [Nitrosomonas ureae]|uniref:dihydrolipoyl dehydrogenase n=1 Tax=Nitrosomonas ureae TaxID=44577 RepID=UPI000D774417|nr:dihydrolipoyl dehydrogenase [Nitrosomonas ureae]PXX17712.1 dihydrolipoamide dehydrogenase [Nitrosomonas ureae]
MNEILDVIIVGGGSAGLSALREVRKHTDRFVIINDGPWGTICARVGCMPSKALIEAANAFHRRNTFEEFGIRGSDQLTLDIPAALQRVRKLRDDFVASTVKTTEELGKRAISGRARLLAPDRLEVNGKELRAHKIIIATGSHPIIPTSWSNSLCDRLLTTDTLFEQETLPAHMAVIGMGFIGVEMAQALSRFGIKVTAFGGNQFAGLTDPQVIARATDLLGKEFPLHLGKKANLNLVHEGIQVRAGSVEIVVDCVLAALGRRPNIDHLGLETLGVSLDQHGMPPVNRNTMQIANLPVFLAGDANDQAPLLHEAADEGYIAGLNAMRSDPLCFTRRTPLTIIFTDPNIAIVGSRFQTLDSAKTLIGEVHFDRQGRARVSQRNKGIQRLYADAESGRLLGAEMCAPAGDHMAHLLALAIDRSLTVQQLLRLPFYHPVLEEGMRTALRALAAQLPVVNEFDLSMCGTFNTEALD